MLTEQYRPPTVAPSILEALIHPNDTAAAIAAAVPQGLLVETLCALTPARLSVDGRIDTLLAVERHIAMLQARSTELLAALDLGDTTEDHVTRDTVAAALRLPPASMKQRMFLARELVVRLPAALESLRAGDITQPHTAALADATGSLPPEVATAVETAVLARAPGRAFPGCRRPARSNDLDHVKAWRHGDLTTVANMASLCRHHHRLKHTRTWTVHRDDTTGTITWTDSRKRTYYSQPPPCPPPPPPAQQHQSRSQAQAPEQTPRPTATPPGRKPRLPPPMTRTSRRSEPGRGTVTVHEG